MQNIKKYKIKINETKKIFNKIGLNPKKTDLLIKTKHALVLEKKVKNNKKIKDELSIFNNFSSIIKNYKYFRNINGYPCRGQRTHTNAKTKKKYKFKGIL
jgi:ribosomal protein S13